MTTRKIFNRKMKLTMVRNTCNGVELICCRASGVYKGYYIERTSTQEINLATPDTLQVLEQLARGNYEHECRIIDGIEKPSERE